MNRIILCTCITLRRKLWLHKFLISSFQLLVAFFLARISYVGFLIVIDSFFLWFVSTDPHSRIAENKANNDLTRTMMYMTICPRVMYWIYDSLTLKFWSGSWPLLISRKFRLWGNNFFCFGSSRLRPCGTRLFATTRSVSRNVEPAVVFFQFVYTSAKLSIVWERHPHPSLGVNNRL